MTTPKFNQEAEENVLGAMLLTGNAIDAALDTGLTWDDFYLKSNGSLFRAIAALHSQGVPVDPVTLAARLERDGVLTQIGGTPKIHALAQLVPAATSSAHYAEIVKEQAALRRLDNAGKRIQAAVRNQDGQSVEDILASIEEMLNEAVRTSTTTQFCALADDLDKVAAEIEEAILTDTPKMGLLTGFDKLDEALTGLHPGQLVLVAARPAMGKSALAQNIVENVADLEIPSALISLEMSRKELLIRSLARAAHIDSKRLRVGKVGADEYAHFSDAKDKIASRASYLFVEDNPSTTIQRLRAEARRLKRRNRLGLLVVDYLQLMISSHSEENRTQEIGAISRGLKLLARELEIPVIALSQLNRNLESRNEKRPQLSDLRDSGSLEQDADVVLFIYRDEYYNPDATDRGLAEIIIAKNRNGEIGTVKLAFVSRYTEFKNLAEGVT